MSNQTKATEKAITLQIRTMLKMFGIWHYKQHQGLGSTPGIPDIIGIWEGGRYLGIEVKTANGKVSPAQQQMIDKINANGGIAFCARSVDEVIEKLGLKDRFLLR